MISRVVYNSNRREDSITVETIVRRLQPNSAQRYHHLLIVGYTPGTKSDIYDCLASAVDRKEERCRCCC